MRGVDELISPIATVASWRGTFAPAPKVQSRNVSVAKSNRDFEFRIADCIAAPRAL
jgi:hypothetical protein